jgi:hypothetical protein
MTGSGHLHPYAASSAIGCRAPEAVILSPNFRDLPPIAAHRDKAQMLGAHLGRLRIVKIPLDAPQPGRIRRVG